MFKILIQKLLTGRLSTLSARLLLGFIRHSRSAATELEQQESAESFLSEARAMHQTRRRMAGKNEQPPWENPVRPVPLNPAPTRPNPNPPKTAQS